MNETAVGARVAKEGWSQIDPFVKSSACRSKLAWVPLFGAIKGREACKTNLAVLYSLNKVNLLALRGAVVMEDFGNAESFVTAAQVQKFLRTTANQER